MPSEREKVAKKVREAVETQGRAIALYLRRTEAEYLLTLLATPEWEVLERVRFPSPGLGKVIGREGGNPMYEEVKAWLGPRIFRGKRLQDTGVQKQLDKLAAELLALVCGMELVGWRWRATHKSYVSVPPLPNLVLYTWHLTEGYPTNLEAYNVEVYPLFSPQLEQEP